MNKLKYFSLFSGIGGKRVKAKDLIKQTCKNAIKRCDEKQRKTKEYWDNKMKEVKEAK